MSQDIDNLKYVAFMRASQYLGDSSIDSYTASLSARTLLTSPEFKILKLRDRHLTMVDRYLYW